MSYVIKVGDVLKDGTGRVHTVVDVGGVCLFYPILTNHAIFTLGGMSHTGQSEYDLILPSAGGVTERLEGRVKELELLLAAKEAEIVELRPKPTLSSYYRNIYPVIGHANSYRTREAADTAADVDRIAVLRVDCIELNSVKTYKAEICPLS